MHFRTEVSIQIILGSEWSTSMYRWFINHRDLSIRGAAIARYGGVRPWYSSLEIFVLFYNIFTGLLCPLKTENHNIVQLKDVVRLAKYANNLENCIWLPYYFYSSANVWTMVILPFCEWSFCEWLARN